MDMFALFDTNKTIVTDKKDISAYVSESIRNIYGIITEVYLDKYEGLTAKETAYQILKENGLSEKEITERLDRYLEDLPYSYYNVAWSDKIDVFDGAKLLLDTLKKKDVLLGIATGEPLRVAKMRLEKVSLEKYFSLNASAENGMTPSLILSSALDVASSEYDLDKTDGIFFSSSKRFIQAAHDLGLYAIGVSKNPEMMKEFINSGSNEVLSSLKEKPQILKKI